LSDVHMHNFIVGGEYWRQVRTMKSCIEHMAVVAPVCSKHDNDALVSRRGLLQSLFDFGVRIGAFVVNFFLFLGRLAKTERAGRGYRHCQSQHPNPTVEVHSRSPTPER